MESDRLFADGVIVIDKPAGPTSHDVVAVMRRAVARRSPGAPRRSPMKVGHTGTLDPLASGVLPLVLGRATRLAQFLSAAEKAYEAEIELGAATTTQDAGGQPVARGVRRAVGELTAAEIEAALAGFRGTYPQQPPAYSAKKIGGDRAYDLARRNEPVRLDPVMVTATELTLVEWRGSRLRVRLVSSAGYYVRALADALGERLGTGGHLAGLVRTRSGEFTLAQAVGLDVLDRRPDEAAARVIPLDQLLPSLPAVTLTPEGASLAARGGFIGPSHVRDAQALAALPKEGRVRLLGPGGRLLAIAEPRTAGRQAGQGRAAGLLHPGVVLE